MAVIHSIRGLFKTPVSCIFSFTLILSCFVWLSFICWRFSCFCSFCLLRIAGRISSHISISFVFSCTFYQYIKTRIILVLQYLYFRFRILLVQSYFFQFKECFIFLSLRNSFSVLTILYSSLTFFNSISLLLSCSCELFLECSKISCSLSKSSLI